MFSPSGWLYRSMAKKGVPKTHFQIKEVNSKPFGTPLFEQLGAQEHLVRLDGFVLVQGEYLFI